MKSRGSSGSRDSVVMRRSRLSFTNNNQSTLSFWSSPFPGLFRHFRFLVECLQPVGNGDGSVLPVGVPNAIEPDGFGEMRPCPPRLLVSRKTVHNAIKKVRVSPDHSITQVILPHMPPGPQCQKVINHFQGFNLQAVSSLLDAIVPFQLITHQI